MALKLIKEGNNDPSPSEIRAVEFCARNSLDLTLEWRDERYWLHSDDARERAISIDVDGELKRHTEYFKQHSIHKELFARAVGVKGGHRPKVLDLTGGLLGDTLLLLSFGCEVLTLERNPIIALLIESALASASHPALSRLKFKFSDAQTQLKGKDVPEVVFFDPMFEDANQKASPKKEMRIFRSYVGKDADAIEVFQLARAINPKRLVVKRPRLSTTLGAEPDVKYEGKSTRYDVYFGKNLAEPGQIS